MFLTPETSESEQAEHKTDHINMGIPYFSVSMHLVLLSILISLSIRGEAAEYRYHFCSNQTFSPNSTYQSNLNNLLSFLYTNSTREGGFYNTTVGQTQNPREHSLRPLPLPRWPRHHWVPRLRLNINQRDCSAVLPRRKRGRDMVWWMHVTLLKSIILLHHGRRAE